LSEVEIDRISRTEPPRVRRLAGTDLLEIRVAGSSRHKHALLIAKLDNLGKGASGAAVPVMRLMLGMAAQAQA
jgi:N-acetyl-gamma-glutamyl-phosphate reductase